MPRLHSVADVLNRVQEEGGLASDFQVIFRAISVQLPEGKRTSVAVATIICSSTSRTFEIKMPACSGLRATLLDGTPLIDLDMSDLDQATAGPDGVVHLAMTPNRSKILHVKNVTFSHGEFLCDFSNIEHAVVLRALNHLGMLQDCYREFAPVELPGVRMLDYARVSGIRIPSLKRLLNDLEDYLIALSEMNDVTADMKRELRAWQGNGTVRNAVARTLRRSGMKQPRHGGEARSVP